MNVTTFSEARTNMKRVLDKVRADVDCTIITRRDAGDAVVISLDYYNSLMETVHLLLVSIIIKNKFLSRSWRALHKELSKYGDL